MVIIILNIPGTSGSIENVKHALCPQRRKKHQIFTAWVLWGHLDLFENRWEDQFLFFCLEYIEEIEIVGIKIMHKTLIMGQSNFVVNTNIKY